MKGLARKDAQGNKIWQNSELFLEYFFYSMFAQGQTTSTLTDGQGSQVVAASTSQTVNNH